MTFPIRRNFPTLLPNEDLGYSYNSYPQIIQENPETNLAKKSPLEYIDLLREKIELDHLKEMTLINTRHKETIRSLGVSVTNNYLNGLSSEHKSEINEIELKPYVWEKGLFGFQTKSEGITIKFKR